MMPEGSVTPKNDSSQTKHNTSSDSGYLFLCCQHGVEPMLKRRFHDPAKGLRLAFSRPGLLTFKLPDGSLPRVPSTEDAQPAAPSTADLLAQLAADPFVRRAGVGAMQVRGELAETLVDEALARLGGEWNDIHVFQRDPSLPGHRGFEPGQNELTESVKALFETRRRPDSNTGSMLGPEGSPAIERTNLALDVVLVEPNHWLIGYHPLIAPSDRWPGGVPDIRRPENMINRAYLKMAEAIAWSQLAIRPGDQIVELGSSPGGASQRLLEIGLKVTGIDPAEMDSEVLGHPNFTHWRNKSSGVKRKLYRRFRWLAADANVAPNYTLDAVEDIVTYPTSRIEGLLLTLKLTSYDLADQLPDYLQRIAGWGYGRVEARQLATNRRELCVVAQR